MADITFAVVGQCNAADPHYGLEVRVGGVKRMLVSVLRSKFISGDYGATPEPEEIATILLRSFSLEWKAANPTGSLAQFRTALEAKVFRI